MKELMDLLKKRKTKKDFPFKLDFYQECEKKIMFCINLKKGKFGNHGPNFHGGSFSKDDPYSGYLLEVAEEENYFEKMVGKRITTQQKKEPLKSYVIKLWRADPLDWICDHRIVIPDYWKVLKPEILVDVVMTEVEKVFPEIARAAVKANAFALGTPSALKVLD